MLTFCFFTLFTNKNTFFFFSLSLFASTFFPLKVEFSWYICFKVGTFFKGGRNEIRLTRLFNYGAHHRYDFWKGIRPERDDFATLGNLILLHFVCNDRD